MYLPCFTPIWQFVHQFGKNKNNVELFRILFSGMFYNSKSNNRNMMLWEEQFLKGKEVASISGVMQLVLGDYG